MQHGRRTTTTNEGMKTRLLKQVEKMVGDQLQQQLSRNDKLREMELKRKLVEADIEIAEFK